MNNKYLLIAFIIIVTLFLSSCSLLSIKKEADDMNSVGEISGVIHVEKENKHPVYAVVIKQLKSTTELVNIVFLGDDGTFRFNLLPGSYFIGAFIDENNNKLREETEKSVFFSQDNDFLTIIDLNAGEKVKLSPMTISGGIKAIQPQASRHHISKANENIGKVTSLDSAMFSADNVSLGLWRPVTFLDSIGGGLFMLQPFEQDKIPVIMVHGIFGSPVEFTAMINSLDRDKYQPWVLYYPSALKLDLVSSYLLDSIVELQAKHHFSDVKIIAHSMGGLMSRSFLMMYQKKNTPPFKISTYMTINSPLYGLESAKKGVKSSPIVVASWRDLAINSDYVKKVHAWSVPKNIPYYLVFSYLPGKEGDGVVPMESQLSESLQQEAIIHGFEAQHSKILKNERFIEYFNKVLSLN